MLSRHAGYRPKTGSRLRSVPLLVKLYAVTSDPHESVEARKFDPGAIRHTSNNKSKKSQAWNPSAGEIAEAQEDHDPGEEHDRAVARQKPTCKAVLDQERGCYRQDA